MRDTPSSLTDLLLAFAFVGVAALIIGLIVQHLGSFIKREMEEDRAKSIGSPCPNCGDANSFKVLRKWDEPVSDKSGTTHILWQCDACRYRDEVKRGY